MDRPSRIADGGSCGKVVGLGLACMDQLLLWRDASAPVAGNRIVQYDVQGGGMVGTALVAVARLGGRAELWTAVGDDWIGRWILEDLRGWNVDVSQVRSLAGQRGPLVVVCVDQPTGQRHFLHSLGLDGPEVPVGSPQRLDGAGCLLVDHMRPNSQLAAAGEARRRGVPVVADLSRVRDDMRDLLGLLDYAILSEHCAQDLGGRADTPDACRKVLALGPRCAVITLGDRGLVWAAGERSGRMAAFGVDVVDTTGAGDTFHGAFCFGLMRGLDLEDNLRFASAVAAMKCRRLGGRAGIPTLDEVLAFLAERGCDLRDHLGRKPTEPREPGRP